MKNFQYVTCDITDLSDIRVMVGWYGTSYHGRCASFVAEMDDETKLVLLLKYSNIRIEKR